MAWNELYKLKRKIQFTKFHSIWIEVIALDEWWCGDGCGGSAAYFLILKHPKFEMKAIKFVCAAVVYIFQMVTGAHKYHQCVIKAPRAILWKMKWSAYIFTSVIDRKWYRKNERARWRGRKRDESIRYNAVTACMMAQAQINPTTHTHTSTSMHGHNCQKFNSEDFYRMIFSGNNSAYFIIDLVSSLVKACHFTTGHWIRK